ncbi:MAG: hypothetical protein II114_06345 [Treponema sp.]|nr:hypothetical protein [Treponema sp.]
MLEHAVKKCYAETMFSLYHGSNMLVSVPDDFLNNKDFHVLDFKKADEQWLDKEIRV